MSDEDKSAMNAMILNVLEAVSEEIKRHPTYNMDEHAEAEIFDLMKKVFETGFECGCLWREGKTVKWRV